MNEVNNCISKIQSVFNQMQPDHGKKKAFVVPGLQKDLNKRLSDDLAAYTGELLASIWCQTGWSDQVK